MNILITGGTGLLGQALCVALLKIGHTLTILSRKPELVPSKCGKLVKSIRFLKEWNSNEAFDAIINLAGEPIIDKAWTENRKKCLWDSRITLTQELISKIEQATYKPKVLISGSAIGYYGDTGESILDESAGYASDFGSQLCVSWEKAANTATDLGVRVCLLRTGLVLSSSGGILKKMLPIFKYGLGARIGKGKQWMSWIHIDDYVDIILKLLTQDNATGAYNMTTPYPVRNMEFTQTLAKVLNRPALAVAYSWLIKLLLGERAYLLLGGQYILPNKVKALGYAFKYPYFEDAVRSLVR